MTRLELAKNIAQENFNNLLLNAVPRIGKSIICTELFKKWEGKILILSSNDLTNKQWIQNLKQYNPDLLPRIDIFCYQSLHKVNSANYDIIVCDEWETALSTKRFNQLQIFKPAHWIAMSGSMQDDDIFYFRLLTNNKFRYIKITLEEAVKMGIISQPTFYKINLKFDANTRNLTFSKGKNISKKNNIVDYDNRWESLTNKTVNTIIKCNEQEYNSLLEEEIQFYKSSWEQDKTQLNKTKYLKKGNERKSFYAKIKSKYFRKLFSLLPEKSRCLIFCNNIEQAELLNYEFSIHSKKISQDNLIDLFNNKEIPYLFSVGMLNRGIDFNDVDYIIIIQTSGNNNENLQQIGRSFLSKNPKIILMCFENCQDEYYVTKLLNTYPKQWVVTKNL